MTFLIDALAVYRLTRLLTRDKLTEKLRAKMEELSLGYLSTCPWCISPYIAVGVVAARRHRWWGPIAEVLAFSAVAGIVSEEVG